MAVVDCVEIYENRQGMADQYGTRQYRRCFRVLTSSSHDGPKVIRAAPGISTGDVYSNGLGAIYGHAAFTATESDTTSFARVFTASCIDEDGKGWRLEVDYAPYDLNQIEASPLDLPPELSWDFSPFEEICEKDTSGNPIRNSAGQYFDPPVVRDNSVPVLTIVRNEAAFLPALAYAYKDKVNSNTPFYGMGVRQVKMSPPQGRSQYHPIYGLYWTVTYRLLFDPRTFDKVILNQGLMQINAAGKLEKCTEGVTHSAVNSPVGLSTAGVQLAVGVAPNYLTFQVYDTIDFSPLSLPGA